MFVGRFSYLANNFHVAARAVGSSFSPGSPEVRGKINFPNMFANTVFTSVYAALHLHLLVLVPYFAAQSAPFDRIPEFSIDGTFNYGATTS